MAALLEIARGVDELWPVLLQDPSAASEPTVGMLRPGYIVFNRWDWAEVIVRAIQVGAPSVSHFGAGRRLQAENSIYRCG